MYEVKVMASFSAAHKLREYQGRCENLHGHNWKVEAFVKEESLDKAGIALDFKELKARLGMVLGELDHTYLNDLPYFKEVNPTSENIARYIFDNLKKDGISISSVSVWESENSSAKYYE